MVRFYSSGGTRGNDDEFYAAMTRRPNSALRQLELERMVAEAVRRQPLHAFRREDVDGPHGAVAGGQEAAAGDT